MYNSCLSVRFFEVMKNHGAITISFVTKTVCSISYIDLGVFCSLFS